MSTQTFPVTTHDVLIRSGDASLPGTLAMPEPMCGLVLFAHGSGSSRHSKRNQHVAASLQQRGFATLLFDLLTEAEANDRRNVFDLRLLADRLLIARSAMVRELEGGDFTPIGYFGASTGGGAAIVAAAARQHPVAAVVSRGGRPDLAGAALDDLHAPTLLLVGSKDTPVIDLNQKAAAKMHCEHELSIVDGATHLFEEPGTLDIVAERAANWFGRHFATHAIDSYRFADRADAGRVLADRLAALNPLDPVLLAIPRGGVPIAAPVAERLNRPLGVALVHKIGAPHNPEAAIGAVGFDGTVQLDDRTVEMLNLSSDAIQSIVQREQDALADRAMEYGEFVAHAADLRGRNVVLIDDGLATGETMRAAVSLVKRADAAKIIVAVPVGAPDSVASLAADATVICPVQPPAFRAVGQWYRRFEPVDTSVALDLLEARRR